MTIENWLYSAEGYLRTAQFLENPVITVEYKIDSIKSSWYLLHHAIELNLKALLMSYNKYSRHDSQIHNLVKLTNSVEGISIKVDNELTKKHENCTIKQWIYFINPFGFPNGGLRYVQRSRSLYAAPLGVSYFFNDLVNVIKSECDHEKVIDDLI